MAVSDNLPQRRTLLLAALILALAVALGVASLTYRVPSTAGSGVALVGGPFRMLNHKGETVTEKSFAGQFMLVFFGFTYCPDVCPTELQVMTAALEQLGPDADKVTPIFVTVDPERDTPDVMAQYIANFHPRFVGLTGSDADIAGMAKAYRVFYQKADNPKRPADYTMDHTSIMYLMGPDGQFRTHFAYQTDPQKLADEIKKQLKINN